MFSLPGKKTRVAQREVAHDGQDWEGAAQKVDGQTTDGLGVKPGREGCPRLMHCGD